MGKIRDLQPNPWPSFLTDLTGLGAKGRIPFGQSNSTISAPNLTDLTALTISATFDQNAPPLESGRRPTQSRLTSFGEAVANVVVGYVLAVVTQVVVFPLFGIRLPLDQNLTIGAVFTVVSLVRSYSLRRIFESLRR